MLCGPLFFRIVLSAFSCALGQFAVQAESAVFTSAADTSIQEFRPTTTGGTGTGLRVGTVGASGGGGRVRAFFLFDPPTSIPPGSIILSASLNLTVSLTVDAMPRSFELHRLLVPWDEMNATWLIRLPPDVAWSAGGGAAGVDYAAAPSVVAPLTGVGSYTFGSTTGLIADVQRWVDNPSKNYGWILLGADEVTDQTARLVNSRENVSGLPRLNIEFEPPFRIDSVALATNQLCVAFQTSAGKSYVVERRAAADSGTWTVVTNIPTVALPGVVTICEPVEAGSNFYRVGRQ